MRKASNLCDLRCGAMSIHPFPVDSRVIRISTRGPARPRGRRTVVNTRLSAVSCPIYSLAILALSWLGGASQAGAHPISLTDALVHVRRDRVTVRLEIFVEDLLLFHQLQPNERDFLEPAVIRQGIEQHKSFLSERFVVRDVHGERLVGKFVGVNELRLEPEGLRLADLMAHRLTYEFEYALAQPPEFLTFSQQLTDEKTTVPAELQLRIKQEGGGTAYEAALPPGEPQTIRFNWEHPPLSAEASQQAWDQWYARQKEETLGITSYSSVYSFLYISDHETRHEILIPWLTLQPSVPIAHADPAFLEITEQDAARPRIAAFFTSGNPVKIDGVTAQPVVQRVDFFGLDFKDFASAAQRRRVSLASARVGVVLVYSTPDAPSAVELTWDRFNRYLWTVNTVVYAYDQIQQKTLSRIQQDNRFAWRRLDRAAVPPLADAELPVPSRPRLSLPLAFLVGLVSLPLAVWVLWRRRASCRVRCLVTSVGLVGLVILWPYGHWELSNPLASPVPFSEEQAQAVFATLLKNAYRAFDYRSESDVYDALAKSVAGPLLRELYLKIRRGLEIQEQGGAVARIQEVRILESTRKPLPNGPVRHRRGLGFHCRWTVSGTVEHWGHLHTRTNEYEAEFTVEPCDHVWKITGIEVLHEQRLKLETTLRGL